jgi:hypothetical protein
MSIRRWAAFVLAAVMALTIPLGTAARTPDVRASDGAATATQPAVTRATNTFTDVRVVGSTADGDQFRGLVDIIDFRVIDGQLVAIGELTGRLRDSEGNIIRRVNAERVRLPVTFGSVASCDILHLRLGPLDLDLLGLVVHLDRIVLDITAEPGPGNLLGNLLCAIAGLLDGGLDLDTVLRDLLRAILEVFEL